MPCARSLIAWIALAISALWSLALLLYATVGIHSRVQTIVGETSAGHQYTTRYREFGTMVQLYGVWTAVIPAALIAATVVIALLLRKGHRRSSLIALSLAVLLLAVTVAGAFTVAVFFALPSVMLLVACIVSLATPQGS